jgi:tetratricopeptide (TPR) repeat protein
VNPGGTTPVRIARPEWVTAPPPSNSTRSASRPRRTRGNSSAALTQAYQNFVAAATPIPTWGQAHYQVGNNACDLKMAHTAVACYRRALECENSDENLAKIYCNLAYQLHVIGHTEDALNAAGSSRRSRPKLALNWVNLSIIHYTLNNTAMSVGARARPMNCSRTIRPS